MPRKHKIDPAAMDAIQAVEGKTVPPAVVLTRAYGKRETDKFLLGADNVNVMVNEDGTLVIEAIEYKPRGNRAVVIRIAADEAPKHRTSFRTWCERRSVA